MHEINTALGNGAVVDLDFWRMFDEKVPCERLLLKFRAILIWDNRSIQLTTQENIITYHNALCFSPKILHKHCLQFLLGVKMAPRETENNAYSNFWGDKQRALWCVMVFSGVVNRALF